jgi:hypothetical protein
MVSITNLSPIVPASEIDPALSSDIETDEKISAALNAHLNATSPHNVYRRLDSTQTFTNTVKSIGISSGTIATASTSTPINQCGLEARSANNSSAAYISLHRPGLFGVHFGLDINNQLSVGGWSLGNNSYKIFHEGSPPLVKAPLPTAAIAGNSFALSWNSVQPGLGVAELCVYSGTGGGPAAFDFFRLPGAEAVAPTLSNRVASISNTGAYSQQSDGRVKSDFKPAPGLEVLIELKPLSYRHWVCTGFDKGKKKLRLGEDFSEELGFIAQDVSKFLPEAVSQPQSEEELFSLKYNAILTCTVKSVQQLHERILRLESLVAQLDAKS